MSRARVISAIRFGLVAGLLFALVVTTIVTVRIWVLNPGGIFHGPDGTNWSFVTETAWSWFAPLCAVAVIVAFFARWLIALRRPVD